jgi:hypothetical protein
LAQDRLTIWETLFHRALELIDSAGDAGVELEGWTFGGGTGRYLLGTTKEGEVGLNCLAVLRVEEMTG